MFMESEIKILKYLIGYAVLLVIREMQIKMTQRYVFPSPVWQRSKLILLCVDKSMRNKSSRFWPGVLTWYNLDLSIKIAGIL